MLHIEPNSLLQILSRTRSEVKLTETSGMTIKNYVAYWWNNQEEVSGEKLNQNYNTDDLVTVLTYFSKWNMTYIIHVE
jgi:hypothetical protein